MTSTVQTFRSTTPTAKPLVNTRQPGELWVNFPDKQLGLIDASQAAQPLIAVRFFSAATSYVSGDVVTQGASLWIAKGNVPAGAFVATQWNQVATYTGGTFASLVLNGPAGTARSLFSQTAGVNRWELQLAGLTSESGSNAGSDFSIYRYNDAGAVIDAPFAITRSTGRATFNLDPFGPSGGYLPLIGGTLSGALSGPTASFPLLNCADLHSTGAIYGVAETLTGPLTGTSATLSGLLTVNGAATFAGSPVKFTGGSVSGSAGYSFAIDGAAGTNRAFLGMTAGSMRWRMTMGNGGPETGANAGSDFYLQSYDDSGALLTSPLTITRLNSVVNFNGVGGGSWSGTAGASAGNIQVFLNKAPGSAAQLNGTSGGILRWSMSIGNVSPESGANAGSDWSLSRYNDAGVSLGSPMVCTRSNGVVAFSAAIVNGPSDRTLKDNIAPIEGALDKVNALQGVSFNMLATPDKREIGLIAQDVEPVVPEIMQAFTTSDDEGKSTGEYLALDYPKLTALLIEAVKTLTARVADLEAKAG